MRRSALPAATLPAAFLLALESVTAVPVEPSTERVSFSGQDTNRCALSAHCVVSARAVEESGRAQAQSRFERRAPTATGESAFGHAGHRLAFKVPPGSRTARATFVWRVSDARAAVQARGGRAFAHVGLSTWAPWCQDECTSDEDRLTVLSLGTPAPGAVRRARGPVVVLLVATVRGPLPPAITWQSWAWAVAGGETTSGRRYAGSGHASITATLVEVAVAFS